MRQKIDLPIDEQPDLSDIRASYMAKGGNFWIALFEGEVVGTIGLMRLNEEWSVLKKFFVRSDFRCRKVGLSLYNQLISFAKDRGVKHLILDTPSVALRSHTFYERAGFKRICKTSLPISYHYPDRNSLLFQLELSFVLI